jgi:hypothetical protein
MAESSSNSSGQQYQKQDHQANTQYTPDVSVLPPFSSANGNNTPPDSGIDEEGVGSELDSSSCTDDSLSWSSFSDVTGQEPFLPLSSSPSSTVSWEYSEYENNLMRRLSQAIRECKYSKVTAVNQSVGDEEALKKLVESLFKEVRDWQSTCLMQPSEDSLTSASSTGSEDQPRGFEEEHKHAVGAAFSFHITTPCDLLIACFILLMCICYYICVFSNTTKTCTSCTGTKANLKATR